MERERKEDVLLGISMYLNWGLAVLKNILPTDVSPQELGSLSRGPSPNELIRAFLDACTCFVAKQYMKDPQLKYISPHKERWFSCVLMGDGWNTVLKGIFGEEMNKKLNKANCLILDFTSTDGEGIEVVLKEKIIMSKDNYYFFKNDIIDKFGLKILDYKPEDYDPKEGNLLLDKVKLTIRCDSTSVSSLFDNSSFPYWLYNALDWETVNIIKIKIPEKDSVDSLSVRTILNKIVIYPDCPPDWRTLDSGKKALKVIETQVGKTLCNFFMYLTVSGEGEKWYSVLNSAVEEVLNQWEPFLSFIRKTTPERLIEYVEILLKRCFGIIDGLTIRINSEYKYLLQHFFRENNGEMNPCKDLIVPVSDESLFFILKKIGDPQYLKLSVSLIKEMVRYIKEQLKNANIQNIYEIKLFISYLEKNISFIEELNDFYEKMIKEVDTQSTKFLESSYQNEFDNILRYLLSILLSEKDIVIRRKIMAYLIYKNKIYDVIPDIFEFGDLDDRYAAANIILELKDSKFEIPEKIVDWAEREKVRAEYILGNEICQEVKSNLENIVESLTNILKVKK